MIEGIKAIAFDIDGTLYSDLSLYIRLPFYFLRNIKFFHHYNYVRKALHKTAPLSDFFEYQARLLAERMKISSQEAKLLIDKVCYKGLEPYFRHVKPYKNVYRTIKSFKDAGYKIGILSDFPPSQKGDIWGVLSLCDVCLGSEECGALKPSLYPFGMLAKSLNVKPEEILYVGNSLKCDVRGAKNAGMKAAYLLKGFKKIFGIKCREADISFKSYRQLGKIVLE